MLYEDEAKFLKRLPMYTSFVLPRLLPQGTDIAVLCNPKHKKHLKNLPVIPFFSKTFGRLDGKYYYHRVPYEETWGLDRYDIQSSIDSDDLPGPNYLSKMREIIEREVANGFKGRLHVHYQPELYNPHTFEFKKMRNKYSQKFGSAFYSIYQDTEDYIGVGHTGHSKMPSLCDKSILLPEGDCWAMVHGDNFSTSWNS